jgi:hypothetical protein
VPEVDSAKRPTKRGVPDDDDYPAVRQSVDLSLAEPDNLFGKNDDHRLSLFSFLNH